jgi:hypothetical protein
MPVAPIGKELVTFSTNKKFDFLDRLHVCNTKHEHIRIREGRGGRHPVCQNLDPVGVLIQCCYEKIFV